MPDSPGYDHNFCVTRGTEQGTAFVAKVTHPDSGRTIEVYSNQPGVQFYTGNYLPEDDSLVGKGGSNYRKHGTICLETQIYPDAINNVSFWKILNVTPPILSVYYILFFFSATIWEVYIIPRGTVPPHCNFEIFCRISLIFWFIKYNLKLLSLKYSWFAFTRISLLIKNILVAM